jgi:nicotinate-nucleotide pyrophosphorylase (carboxylating)
MRDWPFSSVRARGDRRGARFTLLDNMPVLCEAVAVARGYDRARGYDGVRLEASGGLWLSNARAAAETGVDYLAVGR